MSMTVVVENSLAPTSPGLTPPSARPGERSPLVGVALSLAVVGGLMATAQTSSFIWAIVFFTIAIEEEVRAFEVPRLWSLLVIATRLSYVCLAEGPIHAMSPVAGAVVAAALLLPLFGVGFIRSGSLYAAAAFGSIVGIAAVPTHLLLAAVIGVPFALARVFHRANPCTLPVMTLIGIATALYPLL